MGENDSPRATVFKCYQDFIAAYPTSEWADDARKRMIEIAEELADRGKPEYMAIVKAMDKTSDEEVAIAALEALRDVGDDNALDSLLDLYGQSQEGKLRSRIIHVLGGFENPKALQKLVEISKTDGSPELRRRALAALGETRQAEAVPVLKDAAQNAARSPCGERRSRPWRTSKIRASSPSSDRSPCRARTPSSVVWLWTVWAICANRAVTRPSSRSSERPRTRRSGAGPSTPWRTRKSRRPA